MSDPNLQQNRKILSPWANFISIMTIIGGAFSCLGIITAAVGIPMIFAGIRLNKAVTKFKAAQADSNNPGQEEAMVDLNQYFRITGIMTIVSIALTVLILIIYIGAIIVLVGNGGFRRFGRFDF